MKTKNLLPKMAERKIIMSKSNCRNDFFSYLEEAGENLFSEFPQSWDDTTYSADEY